MTVHFLARDALGIAKDVARPFQYPGGELHLKDVLDDRDFNTVWIADVRGGSFDDLGYAAMLANIAHARQQRLVLFLPYLPAARADRGEPLGSRVYAEFINSFNPQQVIGIDAHSGVIGQYIRNLTELDPTPLVERALLDTGNRIHYDGVIAPDKGAERRAQKVADVLGVELYIAHKERNQETGRIIDYRIEDLTKTGKYLVVDDICDGGATFKLLAEYSGIPKKHLGLWVTHGIFSGKAYELRRYYQDIYTTDSHPGHNLVDDSFDLVPTHIVPVENYLYQNIKEFE